MLRSSSDGKRILLVEDHEDTRRLMVLLLKKEGHSVSSAASVEEAVGLADSEPYDVLITDMSLPDGDGHDVLRRLSQRHPVKGVVVSGHADPETVEASAAAGFVAHLNKPLDVDELLKLVRGL